MSLKKQFGFLSLCGLLSSTTAFAKNNFGEILIQGIVPSIWEVNVYDINTRCDFDLDSPEEHLTSRIGTLHVYSNDSDSVGGYLFIESENSGWLINDSIESSINTKHQKYEINLESSAPSSDEPTVNERGSKLTINSSKGYDLMVPATIGFEHHSGRHKTLVGTYDVLVSIPSTDTKNSSFTCTDTITFTFVDDN